MGITKRHYEKTWHCEWHTKWGSSGPIGTMTVRGKDVPKYVLSGGRNELENWLERRIEKRRGLNQGSVRISTLWYD